jgi:hypothetical protein
MLRGRIPDVTRADAVRLAGKKDGAADRLDAIAKMQNPAVCDPGTHVSGPDL